MCGLVQTQALIRRKSEVNICNVPNTNVHWVQNGNDLWSLLTNLKVFDMLNVSVYRHRLSNLEIFDFCSNRGKKYKFPFTAIFPIKVTGIPDNLPTINCNNLGNLQVLLTKTVDI